MAQLIPERLTERREAAGFSQSELARRVGMGQSTANRLEAGETLNPRNILEIARALGTTPQYLMGETDDPSSHAVNKNLHARNGPTIDKSDVVELNEFDLAYGMGSTFIHDIPVTGVARAFSKSWLRQFTDSPISGLFWAHGIGDSMMPTIQDADIMLIDTAQRTPAIWDKLWAVEMGGMGMIKRLRPTKDGMGMRLLSDSGRPEEIAYDGEMNVIGRVVAIVRKT